METACGTDGALGAQTGARAALGIAGHAGACHANEAHELYDCGEALPPSEAPHRVDVAARGAGRHVDDDREEDAIVDGSFLKRSVCG